MKRRGWNRALQYREQAPTNSAPGNTNANPQFVDAGTSYGTNWTGDLRLQASSPCVDAGVELAWHSGATDADLTSDRVSGLAVDMGAYEYLAQAPHGSLFMVR